MVVSSSTSNEMSFLAYDPDVQPYLSLIEFESALKLTNEGKWSAIFFLLINSLKNNSFYFVAVSPSIVSFLECILICCSLEIYCVYDRRLRANVSQ